MVSIGCPCFPSDSDGYIACQPPHGQDFRDQGAGVRRENAFVFFWRCGGGRQERGGREEAAVWNDGVALRKVEKGMPHRAERDGKTVLFRRLRVWRIRWRGQTKRREQIDDALGSQFCDETHGGCVQRQGESLRDAQFLVEPSVVVGRGVVAETNRRVFDDCVHGRQPRVESLQIDERLEGGTRAADGGRGVHLPVERIVVVQRSDERDDLPCPVVDEHGRGVMDALQLLDML